MAEGGKKAKGIRPDEGVERIPPLSESIKSRDEAAALVGVNPRYVSDAKALKAEAPELYKQVQNGKITLPRAVDRAARAEWRDIAAATASRRFGRQREWQEPRAGRVPS
jgi:hypothetical protein